MDEDVVSMTDLGVTSQAERGEVTRLVNLIKSSIEEADGLADLVTIMKGLTKQVKQAAEIKLNPCPDHCRLLLLHFNDVYEIGQAPRFVGLVKSYFQGGSRYQGKDPLIMFSGDIFNPSSLSVVTKGQHMVPVLNEIGVDVACIGNHDLDFGLQELEKLATACNFPWVLSNLLYAPTKKPLAGGLPSKLIRTPEGLVLGILGLVEKEWISTLSTMEEDELIYEDFVDCAKRMGKQLRQEGAHIVIALTHMRVPNDERLAKEAEGAVDIILGGHDHEYYETKAVGPYGTYLCKSGTDFRDLTFFEISFHKDPVKSKIVVEKALHHEIPVEPSPEFPEDENTAIIADNYLRKQQQDLGKVIGESMVDLDCRFAMIRTRETNASNFIADLIRKTAKSDFALLNSGSLRADRIIPKGVFTLKDLTTLVPMTDHMVVIEITKEKILYALENSVSKFPAHEGRFACVSGLRFKFDPTKPPMSRVIEVTDATGEPLQDDKLYSLCTKLYLANGKDGYDCFEDCKVLVDEERLPLLPTMLRYHFLTLSVLNHFKLMTSKSKHQTYPLSVLRAAEKFKSINNHHRDDNNNVKIKGAYFINPVIDGRVENILET